MLRTLKRPSVTRILLTCQSFIRKYHFNLLNLKVGFTKQVSLHPDSEKLYVSQIEVGPNTVRQVCSGLRDHIPLQDFQGRLVVVLDNLKKCKLRGQPSEAMVLCGEDSNGSVQLCRPQVNEENLVGHNIALAGQEVTETTRKIKPKEWENISSRLYVGNNNIVVYKEEDGLERQLCVEDVPIVVDNLPRGSPVR